MNGMDIYLMLDDWKRPTKWIDVCVVEAMFAGEEVPCSWHVVDGDTAYLKGRPKGEVIDYSSVSMLQL